MAVVYSKIYCAFEALRAGLDFLNLPPAALTSCNYIQLPSALTGGEGVVGSNPAASTIFPDPAKKDPVTNDHAIDLYLCRHH